MITKTKSKVERALQQVASQHGVSVESVKCEIEVALEHARASDDSRVQAQWAAISSKGAIPTTEEVLIYLTEVIKKAL